MRAKVNPQMNMLELSVYVQPQIGELASARRHRMAVLARVAKAFDLVRNINIGSHARGTAIRRFSDVDMLIVLRKNEAKWGGSLMSSKTVLDKLRAELSDRYATTSIRRDQQAVVLDFAQGQQSLDVVPALFSRMDKLQPIFSIPDGVGGWMETAPASHDRYFSTENDRSSGKLKKVAQLMKWWRFSRAQTEPMESFYTDLILANSGVCVGVKPYTHCLYQVFRMLADRECRGFRDPLGLSGNIFIAKTTAQKDAIYNAVCYSLQHASAAVAAETIKDFEEANRQWSIVFNGQF